MAEASPRLPLPDLQISQDQIQTYRDAYVDLLGFVPPRIQARTDLLARVDPKLLEMQERLRRHCMFPKGFDTKTAQLMLFGMLLMNLQDAAKLHAVGALRAGATIQELAGVTNLAFPFRGLSAANFCAEIIESIARDAAMLQDEKKS